MKISALVWNGVEIRVGAGVIADANIREQTYIRSAHKSLADDVEAMTYVYDVLAVYEVTGRGEGR